jgi:hypothetical protein
VALLGLKAFHSPDAASPSGTGPRGDGDMPALLALR